MILVIDTPLTNLRLSHFVLLLSSEQKPTLQICPWHFALCAITCSGLQSSTYLGYEIAFKTSVSRGAPRNVWQKGDKSLHLVDDCVGEGHVFPVLKGRRAVRAKNALNLCMHLFCGQREGIE